jgi:Concanavalin A-like lectin/glucanases superfamily
MTLSTTIPTTVNFVPENTPTGRDWSNCWLQLGTLLNNLLIMQSQQNTVINGLPTTVNFGAQVVTTLPASTAANQGYFYLLSAASAYNATILSESSLQDFWLMNETAGATQSIDSGPAAINSSTVSAMTFGVAGGAADAQTAVSANSTASYIEYSTMPAALLSGSFTVEWSDDFPNVAAPKNIIGDATNDKLRIVQTVGNKIAVYSNGANVAQSSASTSAGAYELWMVTYNSTTTTVSFYKNGTFDSSTVVALARPLAGDKLRIGDVRGTSSGFTQAIQKVAVYGSALAATNAANHYAAYTANNDTLWIACQEPYGTYAMQKIIMP